MAKKNQKHVRRKGVKVSLNYYQEKALDVINSEDGFAPATALFEFAMNAESPRIRTLKNKFDYLVNQFELMDAGYQFPSFKQSPHKVPFRAGVGLCQQSA